MGEADYEKSQEQFRKELELQKNKDAIEHRDAKLNIAAVIVTKPGREFFKYLLKSLDVGEVPELGMEGAFLHDRLGFLRAGNSIFKLMAEANAKITGELLAEIEKEKQDELYKNYENEPGR